MPWKLAALLPVGAAARMAFLCSKDRHLGSTYPKVGSRIHKWLEPRWHLIAGVTMASGGLDVCMKALLSFQRSFKVSTDDGYNLREELQTQRPVIFAANHSSFLDVAILAPMVGKLSTQGWAPAWPLRWQSWPFSFGSATLLFNNAVQGTIFSLLCGMPIQPKWQSMGEAHPAQLVQCNEHFLQDAIAVARKRNILIFPEGRIYQDHVEPRDEGGRWTSFCGRQGAPGERVGPLFSGVARIAAHSGARVIPVGHTGLDQVLRAATEDYTLREHSLHTGQDVRVHFGRPLDFGDKIAEFGTADGLQFDDITAPDTYCDRKQELYRLITDDVRQNLLRCRSIAQASF